jgi:uncharacterized protein YgbK (DUF1537 family)
LEGILSLADDATGAMEVGVQFAHAGLAARVWFGDGLPGTGVPGCGAALVLDTETRHLPAVKAYERVRGMAAGDWVHVFKKTDSTLRGNVAAEFKGLMEVFPDRPLVYAPAYPKLGRTVVGGTLFVDGRPLAESAFAGDPLNPARESSVAEVVRECGVPVEVVADAVELTAALRRDGTSRVLICDGSTDDDLAQVAAALHASGRPCLAAGPGSFAGYWILPFSGTARSLRPEVDRCVVVNGSLHPISRQQAEAAVALGWPVLTTPCERMHDPLSVAAGLALEVRELLEHGDFDGLIVFGGDTLYAILRDLGIEMVEASDELLPGVPLTRAHWRGRDLALITKAGGFGQPDVLHRIRCCLQR